MKRNIFYFTLAIEALLCIAFVVLNMSFANAFSGIMAFPFEQIGLVLRSLSLTGKLGNIFALVLYISLSLLPVIFLLRAQSKHGLHQEDSLLILLSTVLFASLYLMTNPTHIGKILGSFGFSNVLVGKAVLGSTVWSVISGYVILRFLRLSFDSGTTKLQAYLSALLHLLSFLFIFAIFGVGLKNMLTSLSTIKSNNNGTESGLTTTYVFIVLRYLVDWLPYILNIITVVFTLDLLSSMQQDSYSESTVNSASRLSRWCGKALITVVVSGIALNLLQLIFARSLRDINGTVNIPITSILFVLATLLFARLISENRRLKSDNDLFI